MKTLQIKKLIEKIEGEAELDFIFNKEIIEDVKINFGFSRGIEDILIGREFYDALVITPRVCGICNHAHLLASVRAIEDGYKKSKINLELSNKAKNIREFTMICELIQNHIKWFYMIMFIQIEKYTNIPQEENYAIKATYLSSTITKALAIFAGQWPHSSYAIPGGVTCDPTSLDVIQAQSLLNESIKFFEEVVIGLPLDKYLCMDSISSLSNIKGDFNKFLNILDKNNMSNIGKSYDRFMTSEYLTSNIKNIKEFSQKDTMAKGVTYKNKLYEVGPLARAITNKTPIIKSIHKEYKNSVFTRIFARVHEMATLFENANNILKNLKLKEDSCTLDLNTKVDDFEGIGIIEAARGTLIHKTKVKNGIIENYNIITPTQWNLSHNLEEKKGIAVKAMIGTNSTEEAVFVLRTFDICSVCTTK